jgi:perosamine synthetase
MLRIAEICKRNHLLLIEDCAEAIGTRLNDRHVGTFGDIATFSFFGNKTITTGEGGMVVCGNDDLAAHLCQLRGQGLAENREYWHDIIGYNYRMTNICAAIGLAQLERIDTILPAKIALAERYRVALAKAPVAFQATRREEEHSYWMVTVLAPSALHRDSLRAALAQIGVETRPVFHPVHTMPMYRKKGEDHPIAADIAARGINLPSWHALDDHVVQEIADCVRDNLPTPV